jgi:hypothetical protein
MLLEALLAVLIIVTIMHIIDEHKYRKILVEYLFRVTNDLQIVKAEIQDINRKIDS